MANKRIKDLVTTKYKGFMALDDVDGTGKYDVNGLMRGVHSASQSCLNNLSPILYQYGVECELDGNVLKSIHNDSQQNKLGCTIFRSDVVEFSASISDAYVLVSLDTRGYYTGVAVGVIGSKQGKWVSIVDGVMKETASISDFPSFNANFTVVNKGSGIFEINDNRGNSITLDATNNGLLSIDSDYFIYCIGFMTSTYFSVGKSYASILNLSSFSNDEGVRKSVIGVSGVSRKLNLHPLGPASVQLGHSISCEGGSITALNYNGNGWGGVIFTNDKVKLSLVNADNYIALAYRLGDDFAIIGLGVTGRNKGQWFRLYKSGFIPGATVPDFPTFSRDELYIEKTGPTAYSIQGGGRSISVDVSMNGLFLTDCMEYGIGLVTSNYYSKLPFNFGKILNLNDFENLQEVKNFKPLYGKKIVVLGDSITAQGYFTKGLASVSGAIVDKTYGISGSTISSRSNSFIDRVANMPTDVDCILVFGGVNDWQLGVTLGQFSDGVSDTSKFYGALHTLCNSLTIKYRNGSIDIPVIFMTPLHAQYQGQTIGDVKYPAKLEYSVTGNGLVQNSYGGGFLKDYVDAIKEVCEFYAIPCIDSYSHSNLAPLQDTNRAKFFQDGLHPNAEGGLQLSRSIYGRIIELLKNS